MQNEEKHYCICETYVTMEKCSILSQYFTLTEAFKKIELITFILNTCINLISQAKLYATPKQLVFYGKRRITSSIIKVIVTKCEIELN